MLEQGNSAVFTQGVSVPATVIERARPLSTAGARSQSIRCTCQSVKVIWCGKLLNKPICTSKSSSLVMETAYRFSVFPSDQMFSTLCVVDSWIICCCQTLFIDALPSSSATQCNLPRSMQHFRLLWTHIKPNKRWLTLKHDTLIL